MVLRPWSTVRPVNLKDPTDLIGAAAAESEKDQRDEAARKAEIEDFKWLVAHAQGRRFLWRLLDRTGVFRTSMTGNSMTFFNEGQRNVGLALLAEFNEHSLDAYSKMQKEAMNG
jgi:hypothetical protein